MKEGGNKTGRSECSRQEEGRSIYRKEGRQWTGRREDIRQEGGKTIDRKEWISVDRKE